MNWETYKGMTAKQKEEFDYRFKDTPYVVDVKGTLSFVVIFTMILTINLFVSFLIMTNDEFIELREYVIQIISSTGQVALLLTSIVVIMFIYQLGMFIFHYWQKKKWMHENNIKIVKAPWWQIK